MNDIAPVSAVPRGPQFDNRRVLAGLIDVALVAVVAGVISVAAGGAWSPTLSAVVLAWGLFYYFAMESGAGQTVGKRLLGLRVTTADGSPADMRAIAIRTVLRVIDGIGLYVVGLIVMLVSGERRQRLGDMAAGTIVTSADARPAPAAASAADAAPAVVLPSVTAEQPTAFAPEAPTAEPLPVAETIAPEPPAPAVEPEAFEAPAPTEEPAPAAFEAPVAESAPAFEPPAVEPAPAAFEAPEPAPPAFEPPAATPGIELPAAETASVPELKPFQPFSTPAPSNGAGPAEPVVETTPEPVVEITPEPVVEVTPEPTVEITPEPVVEIDSGSVADAPDVVIESGPVADTPAEPVVEPRADAAPSEWSFSQPQAEEVPDEPVKVRSVETISAMDLLMEEVEEDEAAGSAPSA